MSQTAFDTKKREVSRDVPEECSRTEGCRRGSLTTFTLFTDRSLGSSGKYNPTVFRRAAVSTDAANLHSRRSLKSSIASVHRRVLCLRGLVMVLALFTAPCFPALPVGASTKSLSSVVWPTTQRGSTISDGTNPKPLEYGTVLTASQLKQVRSLASQWSASYSGTSGFALGYINRFQYPLITTNSGKSWSIGGPYLSGPWADASAGGTIVRALSKSVAII